jgi:hypothetical protein
MSHGPRGHIRRLRKVGVCALCSLLAWFPYHGECCPRGHIETHSLPFEATFARTPDAGAFLLARCCDLFVTPDEVPDHLQTADPVHLHATWVRRRGRT